MLITTRKDAVTIPPVAVQRGPDGLYVWIIKPDKTVEQRPVDAQTVNDKTAIVSKGLNTGEQRRGRGPVATGRRHARQYPACRARAAGGGLAPMNISEIFIRRPIATSLLMAALALVGIVAFPLLPVAPLPQVDFPTINVTATLTGASPETMGATVATPLERQFGQIAGVTQMSSVSSLGSTVITLQFDLDRNIDGAAQDVQAAITAAARQLPKNLTSPPTYQQGQSRRFSRS